MACGGRRSALCLMDKVSSSSSSSHQLRPERKMRIIIIMSVCLVPLVSCSAETPDEENFNPQEWLRRFGYLSRSSLQMSGPLSVQILSRAVSDMQRVYGLEPTGRLDAATLTAMQRPRCALPDRTPEDGAGEVRTRRFALTGQRWDKEQLSFSILEERIPPSLGLNRTSNAIRRAFGVWSSVTPLCFQERPAGDAADILLLFASGFHGDMSLFDGKGGSLAHAFYPGPGTGGDMHFDADEPWTLDAQNQEGIDLFLVAVHELGHALGLEHSENPAAIMAPFYQWSNAQNFSLHGDDIAGVQRMYGPPVVSDAPPTSPPTPPSTSSSPTHSMPDPPDPTQTNPDPTPTPPLATPTSHLTLPITTWTGPDPVTPAVRRDAPPSICDGDFDTVTLLRGEMFVFKGRWFWRVRRNRVLENYPMPISVFWNGLPDDIDAAYERHDGKFVFFKGDRFWLFREADVLPGYPQPLHQYGRGIPAHRIDTAIWWEPKEFTYFFSGDRYWRYNEETRSADHDFPKPISRWGKIPASPRGAFLSDDGASTYFYKGSSYWRFDNRRTEADRGYPRSILKDFMGCVGAPEPDPDPDPETKRSPGTEPVQPPQPTEPGRGPDRELRPGSTEDHPDQEVNMVVTVADSESKVMTLVMVTAPLLLILCILVLVYAILRTLQNKEPSRALVHCKRSLQDWV
ncbi:matrix metalloproteinase-15-like isoform X1 [Poecilia formosa]|uniref:Matrix metallopeptidase 15 n=2 Tax=Poecilia formosa TaxID=48698 RepID=A0A087Y5D0_POEFO|nr:PREDICTED: matrix metalloproteinase-15-like isoform X1 [Poecilia formosa]